MCDRWWAAGLIAVGVWDDRPAKPSGPLGLCCDVAKLSLMNNESKQQDQDCEHNLNTKGRLKTCSLQRISQKPTPFTSAGRSPFVGRRMDFLHTEIALM
jgi:hypothetical protein